MKKILDESGIALVTTLMIGSIIAGIVLAVFYLTAGLQTHTGQAKRYALELDNANAAADYIMASLRLLNMQCGATSATMHNCIGSAPTSSSTNNIINISSICQYLDNKPVATNGLGCEGLSATYNSEVIFATIAGFDVTTMSLTVISENRRRDEVAQIDFVYKLE